MKKTNLVILLYMLSTLAFSQTHGSAIRTLKRSELVAIKTVHKLAPDLLINAEPTEVILLGTVGDKQIQARCKEEEINSDMTDLFKNVKPKTKIYIHIKYKLMEAGVLKYKNLAFAIKVID